MADFETPHHSIEIFKLYLWAGFGGFSLCFNIVLWFLTLGITVSFYVLAPLVTWGWRGKFFPSNPGWDHHFGLWGFFFWPLLTFYGV